MINNTTKLTALIFIFFVGTLLVNAQEIYWADTVIAFSSEYSWETNPKAYRANQILGRPSVLSGQNISSESAWMPSTENYGLEYIIVGFKNPQQISQIIINENLNPGTVISIDLLDEEEELILNLSEKKGFKNQSNILPLTLRFGKTKKKVSSIKLMMNTVLVRGFNQIDAIGVSQFNEDYIIKPNLVPGSELPNAKERLNSNINSSADELVPLITPDGKSIYFTRENHPQNFGYSNGKSPQDVWYSQTDANGNFLPAIRLDGPINNNMNNSICSITPDGQKALLLNVYFPDGSMTNGVSITKKQGDKWGFPEKVEIRNFYNNSQYGEYTLSASGRIIILAIQRNDTYGRKDLYVSFLNPDNIWTEPMNMGHVVNTVASEVSPFLAADEKTLYYASAGFVGYGSQDIYVTRRLDDSWKNWSEPMNLGPNINTPSFDAYYSLPASGEYAYFSSGTTDNGTDIFRIKLPENARPKPVVLVKGFVLNAITKAPVQAKILYESLTTGKETGEAVSDSKTGYYSIALPSGEKFGFRANVTGYASVNQNIDLTNLKQYEEITRDLLLVPLEQGNIIRLNNVFFDYDKTELKPETHLELDRLVTLLNEYPNMTIEIAGHTDNLGSDSYNKNLSRKRAKAVYDYLISKAISKKRITFKGYGKDKPLKPNDSDDNRQENRRVEFKIVKI